MFSLGFDVRYNDDHTGQALLDRYNFDTTLMGLCGKPLAMEEIIKSSSPVGVGRTFSIPP